MEHILKLNEVNTFRISQNKKNPTKDFCEGKVTRLEFNKKIDQMMKTIESLEFKLTQKADEVVSYQVLTQRQEIDELTTLLNRIEKRLAKIENSTEVNRDEEVEMEPIYLKRRDKHK